jgi:uncharacterized protein (TIGR03435 family)
MPSVPRQNAFVGTLAVSAFLGVQLYAGAQGATRATPSVVFEVASVKPNASGDLRAAIGVQPGGRYLATNITPRDLVASAYGLQSYQVVGGPSWFAVDRFDVIAKTSTDQPLTPPPPGGPPSAMQLMVRALLADRFSLVSHTEMREMPVYHLVLARGDGTFGRGIRPSAADCSIPQAPGPAGQRSPCGIRLGPGFVSAGGRSMAAFASILSQFVQRSVTDQTGISGTFEFDLSWTPELSPSLPPEGVPAADPDRPILFTAVQEQLGLKLQAARSPLVALVIDRVERPAPD